MIQVFLHLHKLGTGTLDEHPWHGTSIPVQVVPREREEVVLPDPRGGSGLYETWRVTRVVHSPPRPGDYPASDPRSQGSFVTLKLR